MRDVMQQTKKLMSFSMRDDTVMIWFVRMINCVILFEQ